MKVFLKYQNSFPILLLSIYALGYAYLKCYYWVNNIDIEYYINLTDIIFFTINLIILFVVPILFLEFFIEMCATFFILRQNRKKLKFMSDEERNKILHVDKNDKVIRYYFRVLFVVYIICILTLGQFVYSTFFFVVLLLLKGYHILKYGDNDEDNKTVIVGVIFFVSVIASIIFGIMHGKIHNNKIIVFTSTKEISFNTSNQKISTINDENCIFMGQTTDYIFLYDKKSNKSCAYKKDSLEKIEFSN